MNFIANKKFNLPQKSNKKKLKQSKLDGFLKCPAQSRSVKANRSAMLQEFFMGAVGLPKRRGPKSTATGLSSAEMAAPVETSFASLEPTAFSESRVVMAITEGRSYARGEVGLAAIDTNAPELILCQLSDDMWYSGTIIKIQMLNPAEVLLPNTFFNAKLSNSKLLTILRSTFPTVEFKETPRKHFHDFEALERIEKISATNIDNVKIALENKYYALASCNALLSYVGIAYYLNFAPKSLKVVYESRYASMTIDMETSKRLELVSTLSLTNERKTCLFSYMDHCMTRIGKRSLRARILEPLADLQMIKQCHEAIAELLEKENYQCTLRMILKKFYQVDRLMKLSLITSLDDNIKASETMISLTLMLKNCLNTIPMLLDILASLESPVFVGIRAGLEDSRYKIVLEHIDRILFINEPQHNLAQSVHVQRINAVKPNVDQVLDLSREFYTKIIEEISILVRDMSTQYDLSFQLIHNATKGYQLSLMVNRSILTYPEELTVVTKKANKIVFTTDKLNDLNARLKRIVDDIMVTSNKIISEMLMSIRQEIDVVYLLTGIITELDLIQCFANLSRNSDFCCPTFGPETKIVEAVHPFLEFGRLKSLPVPNNIIATPDHSLFIITGPNMGGKTVYIKMIAVLQVMAQIGCFVPATEAQFRICDKLFSRIGFEDSIDKGISSFGMEVEQMSFILNNVTPNSLVIIDELGRGTNPGEGQEWAWKMCEQLAVLKGYQSNGNFYVDDSRHATNGDSTLETRRPLKSISSPFVYVTTHFMELTKLPEKYFNIINLFLVAEENNLNGETQLKYTHRVQVGITSIKEYGLALARTVKFPRKVIPKAERILERIKDLKVYELIQSSNGSSVRSSISDSWTKEKLLYDLYASAATVFRKVAMGVNRTEVEQEFKGVVVDFGSKCSQDLIQSIRNLSLRETFNESQLFRDTFVDNNSGSPCGSLMRANINNNSNSVDEIIPETPEIVLSNQLNETAVTETSWLSENEPPEDKTILSKLSYHSLVKRIAERANQSMDDLDLFNENKGFPVLPYVKPLPGNRNRRSVEFQVDDHESIISPQVIDPQEMLENRIRELENSPDLFDSDAIEMNPKPREIEDKYLLNSQFDVSKAGGDNIFNFDGTQITDLIELTPAVVPNDRENKSFFEEINTDNDDDDPWAILESQLQGEGFKFDSPDASNNFFASQFVDSVEDKEVEEINRGFMEEANFEDLSHKKKSQRIIPCTFTNNTGNCELGDDPDEINFGSTYDVVRDKQQYQESKKGILIGFDQEFPCSGRSFQDQNFTSLTQRSNEIYARSPFATPSVPCSLNNSIGSGDSRLKFRLGLLDLHEPSQRQMIYPSNNISQGGFQRVSGSPASSVKSEPHEFITKYGRAIESNYRKSQSQSQLPIRYPQDEYESGANAFLEKYGAKLMEKKLFKEPPIRYPIAGPSKERRPKPHFNSSITSSISSVQSEGPSKKDYSEWLGQYCRSRVKSLGVPVRKRSHNQSSSMRSNKSKLDIETVNKRWESYYTEQKRSSSGGGSANGSFKRVSFNERSFD